MKRRWFVAIVRPRHFHKRAEVNDLASARLRYDPNPALLNSEQPFLTGLNVRETVVLLTAGRCIQGGITLLASYPSEPAHVDKELCHSYGEVVQG
jgi:hypothetical protein